MHLFWITVPAILVLLAGLMVLLFRPSREAGGVRERRGTPVLLLALSLPLVAFLVIIGYALFAVFV